MAQPQWITPAGTLGVIPEGVFFQQNLQAIDPSGGDIFYIVIAGELPAGIQLNTNGQIVGVPSAVAKLQGVPLPVSEDVTSKFTVRAYTNASPPRIADRTFTLTVSGDEPPEFITPPGSLGTYYDSDFLNIQIEYTNNDPADTVIVRFVSGQLPGGIRVSETGLISGYIQPAPNIDKPPGYDFTPVSTEPYDFIVSAVSRNYQFTLEVTDGKSSNLRTFEFFVFDRASLTADNTTIFGSSTLVTADETTIRKPFLINAQPSDLGTVRGDNYFSYQFIGNDYDTPVLRYAIIANDDFSNLDLELDPGSGWLYGYIPDQGITETNYSFDIVVYEADFANPLMIVIGTESGTDYIIAENNILIQGGQTFVLSNPIGGLAANTVYTILSNTISEPDNIVVDPITDTVKFKIADSPVLSTVTATTSANIVIQCTATDSGTNIITCNDTTQLGEGQPLIFTGTGFGGVTADPTTIYYVLDIVGPTEFTVSASPDSTIPVELTTASGTMTANLVIASDPYEFALAVSGNIDAAVTWLTPANLGTIDNGTVSLFKVEAVNRGGRTLSYRLRDGAFNELPQGLTLLPTGEIAGRVSFNTFSIDLGRTTFDARTTWDSRFTFTVNAFAEENGQDVVSVFKTFTIVVNRAYNKPYQNLAIQALPPENDRVLIDSLLSDSDIFVPDFIFRPDDPYFGKAQTVVYEHAFGLDPETLDLYVSSLDKNHYWKNLILGSIETARAVDSQGAVIYEVVYSRVIGGLLNNQGQSVSKIVNLPYAFTDPVTSEIVTQVYPNSLINMRDQVIDVVGQQSNILPLWMTSRQADGRVLGFTPAWVLCYTKPGRSQQIAYYLNTQFGEQLNRVDFKVDRYILDTTLSKNWDPETQRWSPAASLTTFDRFATGGNTFVGVVDIATNLAYNDVAGRTITDINNLGGLDGVISNINNNTIIFVKQENYSGYNSVDDAWQRYIFTFDDTGFDEENTTFDEAVLIPNSPINQRMAIYRISVEPETEIVSLTLVQQTAEDQYVQIRRGSFYRSAELRYPSSPGAGLSQISWLPLETVVEEETIFDQGSVNFVEPVDMYDPTDAEDKYLVFPKTNILD
jgi:hypothetical protein